MLTDQELQSLRNHGNEAEAAADEIVILRARVVELAALVPIAEAAERERCARIVERINGWTGTREIAAEIRGETNVLRA